MINYLNDQLLIQRQVQTCTRSALRPILIGSFFKTKNMQGIFWSQKMDRKWYNLDDSARKSPDQVEQKYLLPRFFKQWIKNFHLVFRN